jgi:hypothetical protein
MGEIVGMLREYLMITSSPYKFSLTEAVMKIFMDYNNI